MEPLSAPLVRGWAEFQIAVVGCGSTGLLLAAALVSRGYRVQLYCMEDSKVVQIASHGVRVVGRGEALVKVSAAHISLASSKHDLIIFTLPLNHAMGALQVVSKMLRPNGHGLLFVQPSPELLDYAGKRGVNIAGYLALYTCAWQSSGNIVEWVGEGTVRCAGSSIACEVAESIASALGVRMESYPRDYVEKLAWDMLAAAASLQPLSALLGVGYSKLSTSPHAVQLALSAAREVGLVAEAAGVKMLRDPSKAVRELLELKGCRPKMLRDIEARNPSEIEYINGYIVRKAAGGAVYTPYNMALYLSVKALEDVMKG